MVGSGSGLVGLARNFVCNFRIGSGFFEFRVKYFGPYSTRHLVGSGIFREGWSGLSGRVALDQVYPKLQKFPELVNLFT